MTLTTPGLLFPAISLLLLAYTNRFLVIAQLIRQLNDRDNPSLAPIVLEQIANLRKRAKLIKAMQMYGVISFLFCTFAMFALFLDMAHTGTLLFGTSLCFFILSLLFSLYEVFISCHAIEIELKNIEKLNRKPRSKNKSKQVNTA